MKEPKRRFNIGDKIWVDGNIPSVVAAAGLFKRKKDNGARFWKYQLGDSVFEGFWAAESRIEKRK
jgi:hypothetical protein